MNCIQQTTLNWCPLSKADSLLGKTNLKQGAHIHQPTAWPPPNRHVHSNITHAVTVAAMDSCFALIGAHQHGTAIRPLYGQSQCLQRLFTGEASAKHSFKHQLHTTHIGADLAGNPTAVLPWHARWGRRIRSYPDLCASKFNKTNLKQGAHINQLMNMAATAQLIWLSHA